MKPGNACLVIGAAGFLGRHVCSFLVNQGFDVHGFVHRESLSTAGNPRVLDLLGNRERIMQILDEINPSAVINVAGTPHGRSNFSQMVELYVTGTDNLFQAILHSKCQPRLIYASSSAVYGEMRGEVIMESDELQPCSEYGLAKLLQEKVGFYWQQQRHLKVVGLRLFNLIGPGISAALAPGQFARQIAVLEKSNKNPVLEVGNLAASRDYVDVRDAAKAIGALINHESPDLIYNVASGQEIGLNELVGFFAKESILPGIKVQIRQETGSRGVQRQKGDAAILKAQTGWTPSYSIAESVRDTLTAERSSFTHEERKN